MLSARQKGILFDFGNRIVRDLKEQLVQKKINATGDLSSSIRFEVDDTGLRVYALDYLFYADFGRKPGKFPPRQVIKDWITAKHLTFDIPIDSLAFLIQRKIAEKGTDAWEQGGKDILESVITDDLISDIYTAFEDDFIREIRSEFYDIYKVAA